MTDERSSRESVSREKTTRTKRWKRPSVLPSPDERPGWAHRWVRAANRDKQDPTNISSKLREGWEFCKAKDYPEIQIVYIENEVFKDNVMMGGLVLCRAPIELVQERKDFYKDQTAAQMTSVNRDLMRDADPRMPVFNDSKTEIQFGKGARASE